MCVSTALHGQNAATVKYYSRLCIPLSVNSCGQINRTVLNGKFTIVIEEYEVACRIICNCDSLAIQVKSYLHAVSDVAITLTCVINIAYDCNIVKNCDSISILCSCESLCKSLISQITDSRNNLYVSGLNGEIAEILRGDLYVSVACSALYLIDTYKGVVMIYVSIVFLYAINNGKTEGYGSFEGRNLGFSICLNGSYLIGILRFSVIYGNKRNVDLLCFAISRKIRFYSRNRHIAVDIGKHFFGNTVGCGTANADLLVLAEKVINVIGCTVSNGIKNVRFGILHFKRKSYLEIGVFSQNFGIYVDSRSKILNRSANILVGKVRIICRYDGVIHTVFKLDAVSRNNYPAKRTVITCKVAAVGYKATCRDSLEIKVKVAYVLAVSACLCLFKSFVCLEVHNHLERTNDITIARGPNHIAVFFRGKCDRVENGNCSFGKIFFHSIGYRSALAVFTGKY